MTHRTARIVIAIVCALAGAAILLMARAMEAVFMPMYADFGGPLPDVTYLAFSWLGELAIGAAVALPGLIALASSRLRWVAAGVSAIFSIAAIAFIWWAAYAPLFAISSAVR
jgi:hypothetical protein